MPINPDDYYVITSRAGERPDRWSWEIRRKSQPLGIKMTADGFQSGLGRSVCRKEGVGGFSVRSSKGRQAPTQVRPPAGLFRISAIALDRLPQPFHHELD